MDEVETKMGELLYKVAKELDLEANKSVKLESNAQHGHFFRVTLKVRDILSPPVCIYVI
jgi:DNA mismatch repair protein MSH2